MISIKIKKLRFFLFLFILFSFLSSVLLLGESQYGWNYSSVEIPDYNPYFPDNWVCSSIYISGAPADAVVTGIDVTFSCQHPYGVDLDIDLNDGGLTRNCDLWQNEFGSNPSKTVNNISTFNGLPVNGIWNLWAKDCYEGDVGRIDWWTITIYYASSQKTYYVEAIIANPTYGTDADNDGFYETFNFEIWVSGNVSSGSEIVYAKVICNSTGQVRWSNSPWTIYTSGTNYYSFNFSEADFAGHINGNTNLDFMVELWDSSKLNKLAITNNVIGEPIKADDYIPPTYSVYGIVDSFMPGTDVDGDGYYETFSFRIGVDGDVSPGSATIYGKIICNTTSQEWWFPSSWIISGLYWDYQYFAFDETFFSNYLSVHGNTDLNFTVEIWDSTKSTRLDSDSYVAGEPIKADYFSGPPATVTVHGKMEYEDFSNNRHPIRYAKVVVLDGTKPLGNTYTDGYGNYSINVNNIDPNNGSGADIRVTVSTEGTAGAYQGTNSPIGIVKDPQLHTPWFMISQPNIDNLKSDLEINLTALNSSDNAGAFSVYDAIVEAFIKAYTIYNYEMPVIAVIWQSTGTYYQPGVDEINLVTGDRWDRDVILHEYGHFIQDILGFQNGSVGNSNHLWDEDLRYFAGGSPTSRTDEEAMNLAFREAWPTFFSISVQYGDNSFPNSGDSIYQDTEDSIINDDLEQNTSFHFSPGEFYESMNCCTLWDIFDSQNHAFDNNDTLNLGHDEIWNIVRTDKPNKISDFWNSWFTKYSNAREITRVFLDHRMSFIAQTPVNISPADGIINQPLSLTLDWDDATNATSYDVYFGETGNLQKIGATNDSNYPIENLEYYTAYQWQIIARDSRAEAEGPIWSFHTLMEHTVSAPNSPSGPSVGDKNISFNYSTSGAFCSYGHILQYRFDWGDGTFSDWSTLNTASHTWAEYGTYTVKAQARCANDINIISSFSTGKLVTIEKPHFVTTPSIPDGNENCLENLLYTFHTGGSSCSHDHNVEYRFDWGDGTLSNWTDVKPVDSHAWNAPGTYTVRSQARCAVNTSKVSGFSQGFTVNVSETHILTIQGDTTGIPITVTPNDLNNSGDGSTTFSRIYNMGIEVTLTASPTHNGHGFIKWVIDGVEYFNTTVQVTMDQDRSAIVYYNKPQEPEINIVIFRPGGSEIPDGGTFDFGNIKIGNYTDFLFFIENNGLTDLTLSGSPVIVLEGPDSDQFSVERQPGGNIIPPGSSVAFEIRFTPTSEDRKYANISITNNDTIENPYDINFIGTGIPVIGIPTIQREALIALYNSTNGDNWTNNSGWKYGDLEPDGFAARGTENTWYGVYCGSENIVISIDLSDNNLVGTIPLELRNIKHLEFLTLSNNHLNGNIPTELGNVTDLFSLLINGNKLKGSLPTSLTNLTRLGQTNIGYNLLYTDDDNLHSFLNDKDPDWESSQTTAPTGFTAVDQSNFYIELNWNPIQYTSNPGGYRVFYSTTTGGPYTFFDSTSDKTITSMKVTGLSPGINYYFVVQTRTEASAFNQNILDSDYSEELAASTTAVAAINVTSPNGGESWEVNSVHNITWNSYGLSGNIKIEYSTDNGNTWKLVTSSTENDGSYPWSIPYDASSQCKIRLGYGGTSFIDTSDEVFSIVIPLQLIVVTSPNGGETWNACSTPNITWTSHGYLGTIKLEYSIDNGFSWNFIDYTENDGSHPWTIPVVESSLCLVRISQMGGTPSDTSDSVFTIINEIPSITVTSPNGGETWPARSYREITWTSNNVDGNVKIEYTSMGSDWKEIVSSTENDGSYYWSVVNDPWPICYLRISEIDGDPSDTSDYPFAIDYPPLQISEIERIALIDLYNSTNGDNWTNNSGWKTPPLDSDGFSMPGTEYTWYGVTVVAYTRVERISLNNNNLTGYIPNSIGNLSQLVSLYLYRNQITGNIPDSIGNLSNLQSLYLYNNQLSGTLPASLGNLSNLSSLLLDNNLITGIIPDELVNLSNLRTLSLFRNNFYGDIPPWIGNLSNLLYLYLPFNNFTGNIPSSLGNLSNLMALWIHENNLNGSIPEELGNLSNLSSLYLHSNQLEGSIPASLGNLSNLVILSLHNNRLSGNIPEELGNLSNLSILYLQSNLLIGHIPLSLTNLANLGNSLTDIGYNAIYTDDETLRTFLNEKDPDWESTQTIVPANVSAVALSGDSIQLNWTPITYIGDTGGYRVYFSMTSGGPYTLYDTTTDKTTSSMIATGLDPGTTYYFKVQSVTDPNQNNQNMVISENSPEVSAATLSLFYIQVTSPNGDENYEIGTLQNITWTTMGPVGDVKIEYSTDNGSTWIQVVGSKVNDGIHPWTIPDNTSSNCLIKISEVNGSLTDSSNNTFSIVPVPTINITFPDGGESFEVGSLQNLTWSSLGTVGNVRIEYSTDNGLNWIDIVSSTDNDGVHSWTIPDSVSSQCLIRISELDGNPSKTSAVFSIVPQPSLSLIYPNGGENLEVRSKQGVTWSSIGNIESVKLEYSTDNGSNWTEITPSTENDGFNLWEIPDNVSSECRFKISTTNETLVDTSDSLFSIIPEPTITIISPDGGEIFEVGSTQNITWSTTGTVGNVRIEYSTNNGAEWSEIVSSTENDGSYEWIIPDIVSSQCLTRISEIDGEPIDTSKAIFSIVPGPSITVDSPNGGENFEVGTTQNISWTTTGTVGNVRIEYSTNNGANWTEIVSSTENNSSYLWAIPDTISAQCKVRISEIDGDPTDISDDIFSIVSIPSITVISPNGGEKFEVGSSQNIQWTTSGIVGNIKIEYSTNNGSSWIEIIASTENDGSYTWVTPNAISSQCLIKISEIGEELSDTSDNAFLIVPVPLLPEIERNALIDLYNNTNGDNWSENSGWKNPPLHTDGFAMPGTEESWAGITIDNNHVLKIELINNNLSGSIPASISNLSNLQLLNLNQNQLTGNIPSSLGNLSNLKFLYLQSNQLTGNIPPELGNIANLVGLYLNDNEFSNDIPSEIGNISGLLYLELQSNLLSGTIPQELSNLLNLQILKINSNKLSGRIPIDLKDLTGLSNSDTDIGYNALYTDDADIIGFLNNKDPDWADTQTIAPSDVSATALSDSSIQLNWAPIPYSTDNGGYLIFYSTNIGGDYTLFDTTVDKTISSSVITGLTPNTTFYFLVQTKTEPHEDNNNTVISKYSNRAVTSTVPIPVIIVTSPNGGETWEAGSSQVITWNSTGTINNVIIEYSTSGGTFWATIAPSTANTGSYPWTVPDNPSDNCLVRVSGGYADDAPSDRSDEVFSIVSSPLPALKITSPNGGERLTVGSPYEITWNSNGAVGDVKLEYSIDNGVSWIIIVPSMDNNGSFYWTVPDTPSESCLVRVGESDKDIGISDVSDGGFSIVSAPFITVTSPNGGENWEAGATHSINWTSTGIDGNVKIEYSTTNGTSWTTIAAATDNTGIFNWTVPGTPAENCLIKISDIDGEPTDVSDSVFSIVSPPSLTVTSPNGGENWNAGSTHNITWTSSGNVGQLNIEYSIDNGSSWLTIATSVDNNGSYSWIVPDNPAESCLVRISESNKDGGPSDISNAVFSIIPGPVVTVTSPNGGERLEANTAHQVTWNSSGTIGEIKIEYSTDNGSSWSAIVSSTANDGSHSWTVPDNPSKSCLIRISETDGEPADISDAVFSIVSPSSSTITITSPNGGESLTIDTTHEIIWTGTGMEENDKVMIEYSPDNGGCWLNIVPAAANTGGYTWTVPDNPAESCLIRIAGSDSDEGPSDTSDEPFAIVPPSSPTITVTSPNGGETLTSDSTHDITWTCSGMETVENVVIECSTDSGANWTVIAFCTSDMGSFNWNVPGNPSDNCLVQIRLSDTDEGPSDTSDEVFSIISAPVITVTSPNGGEQWKIGSLYNITWSSTGITGDIVIDLYRGTSFDLNIGSVSVETGSFAWNIPANFTIGNDYKIFLHKDSTEDYSDGEFSLVDQEPNQPDFNNDGHVDILWRNYATGSNEVWLMNGSIRTETSSLPALPDLNWRIVGTGDFNRDGKVDILWRNYTNGQNLVWYMDGTIQTGFEYLLNQPDVNCQIAGTGDFNGDGNVDILWRNPLEGRNQVWYMEGVNVKGYQGLQSLTGIQWRAAGIGDFNDDSHVDILWRNYSTGGNEVWYMNGASRISTAAVLEMSDLNWQIVGTGDFNRDGELDILWRNYSDGTNMIWYMNGITRTGYEYIETRSDLNWRVTGNGDYQN